MSSGIEVRKVHYPADAMMLSVGWKGWDAWQVLYDGEVLAERETKAAAEKVARECSDRLN
jgi:hypothetical protein